jgi:hypothetical protein
MVSKFKKFIIVLITVPLLAVCLYSFAIQFLVNGWIYLMNRSCTSESHCVAFGDGPEASHITVNQEEVLQVGETGRWGDLLISVTSVEPITTTNQAHPPSKVDPWEDITVHVTIQNAAEVTTTIRGARNMSHLQGLANEVQGSGKFACMGETTNSRMVNRIEFGPRARIEGTLTYDCFRGTDTFWVFGDIDNTIIFQIWEGNDPALASP